MKKIISLIVLFALAGCMATPNTNPALSDAHLELCKALGQRVTAQDNEFRPALSLSSLVWNELPVVAEDFQNGILTCSLDGHSEDSYAIAYSVKSDVLLHQKFSGNNKTEILTDLTKEVAVVEQEMQNSDHAAKLREQSAEKLREENAKKQREEKARRDAEKSEQIEFCMAFGEKYADILKVHDMTVGKVSVSDTWDSGDSVTCVNNYDGYWNDDEEESEQLQEQHVINKTTGEYQTIFR